jgi:hypothetical protein
MFLLAPFFLAVTNPLYAWVFDRSTDGMKVEVFINSAALSSSSVALLHSSYSSSSPSEE